jgi:hypothetical protein
MENVVRGEPGRILARHIPSKVKVDEMAAVRPREDGVAASDVPVHKAALVHISELL